MMEPRSYSYKVRSQDVDSSFKARLTAILGILFEIAETDAGACGIGSDRLSRDGHGWIFSKVAIEADRVPDLFEELTVQTWISENRALLNTRNFRIIGADGAEIVRARSLWCILDYASRKPVLLETYGKELDACLSQCPPPCEAPCKFTPHADFPVISRHTVLYTELDFNNHLNTLRYCDIMLNSVPRAEAEDKSALRFDAHFSKEFAYGEQILIASAVEGRATRFFEFRKESGEPAFYARISRAER